MKLTHKTIHLFLTPELRDQATKVWRKNFDVDYKTDQEIFYDACFCILAPQAKFANNLVIVNELKEKDFYNNDIPVEDLAKMCRKSRFYNVKARRLLNMKVNFPDILEIVRDDVLSDEEKRSWLVHNVKGFGMKAASHFLRNMGVEGVAILDTHVFKFLECEPPKSRAQYYELESMLDQIATKNELTIADLDLIIWQHYADVPWDEYTY